MNKSLLKQLLELSAAERIELAEELWDSIEPEEMPPLTAEQEQEVERRPTGTMLERGCWLVISESGVDPRAGGRTRNRRGQRLV